MFGVIGVGYSASINTPNYLLEEDKSNNSIQITARDGTSGLCVLTQEESDNKINIHLTTPEEKGSWEIHLNPIMLKGVDMSNYFAISTNIKGEKGSLTESNGVYRNWIVNQNRYMINIYIPSKYSENSDILSWSCFDENGPVFIPSYDPFDNRYFTTRVTGFGSGTLTVVSTPPISSSTPTFTSRFNSTKKYPLDLNFYWGSYLYGD